MFSTLQPHVDSSRSVSALQVALLGQPLLSWSGAAVALRRRQTRAMFYCLAAEPRPVSRDQLCFLLWPDEPDAVARRNLSVTLNHLRRALPAGEALLASGDAVGLDGAAVSSDVAAFLEAVAAWRYGPLDRLAGAVELVRGPFLDGFVAPSDEYGQWLDAERASWQRRHMQSLAALVEDAGAARDYPRAIAAAERGVAVDPQAEELHARLIALYSAVGDRPRALAQFERCIVVLDRELGVNPLPSTRAVYEAVRDGLNPLDDGSIVMRGAASINGPGRSAEPAAPLGGGGSPMQSAVPAPVAPLLGRDDAVDAACELLVRGSVRLLTLSGPGGSGKTRLAMELGGALQQRFGGGAVWVPLAPLRDAAMVADAIVQACGLQQASQSPREQLLDYVRDRELLLILDNFEHLLPAAPLLAELLAAGPRLCLLVTSRTLLNLHGEHAFVVPPLPLPELDPLPPLDVLAAQPAVALLLSRARQQQPALVLDDDNAAALAAICVRLDGLPLAIELAAARLRLLSPSDLLGRLGHRLRLLGGGARDLPERQRTMRGVIEWSERLLGHAAQQLLAQLAVFAGGWTLEAAETICGAGVDAPNPVLDGLAELLGAHLVAREDGPEGEVRFVMLEIVREYALERLQERGLAAEAAAAHAAYYLKLAEQTAPRLCGPEQAAYLLRLDAEHANMLIALQALSSAGDVANSLRCATALGRFWAMRGLLHIGRDWLERLLAMAPIGAGSAGLHDLQARAYDVARLLAFGMSDYEASVGFGAAALAIRRALGRPRELALALLTLSADCSATYDAEAGAAYLHEGITLAQRLGDADVAAALARAQGRFAKLQDRMADARAGIEGCLAFHRARGDAMEQIIDLFELAYLMLQLGDTAAAQAHATEAHEIARGLRWGQGMAVALRVLGDTAWERHDNRRAEEHHREALRVFRAVGNRRFAAFSLLRLGNLALERGDTSAAHVLFADCLEQARRHDSIAPAMLAGYAVATAGEQPLRAARWWGAAQERFVSDGWIWLPIYEQTMQQARACSGEPAFSSALEAGRALSIAQAIAEVAANAANFAADTIKPAEAGYANDLV